jgi:phosphoribosyl-ATP pyrophosphohydrolase
MRKDIFEKQIKFQNKITGVTDVRDDQESYKYQIIAMFEELGEVVKADKRYKTHRKSYDRVLKIYELADVYIVFMNMLIYSGISYDEFMKYLEEKMRLNFKRIEENEKA